MRAAVAALPVLLVPALGLAQGGFHPDSWVWATTLAAWAVALVAVFDPDLGALRRGWVWLAATAAVAAWTLLSAVWSAVPSQTFLEARRALLYLGVVAALLALWRRGSQRILVLWTHAAITALLAYSLLRYLFGTRHFDPYDAYLLSRPVGYANAVGILATIALLLAAGIVDGSRRERVFAVGSAPLLGLVLMLTDSTGAGLGLFVGAAVVAIGARSPRRALAALALVGVPAGAGVALGRLSRFAETVPTPRLSGAPIAGIVLVLVLAAAAAAVPLRLPAAAPIAPERRRWLIGAVVVVVLAVGVAGVAQSKSKEPRASYWHVAWSQVKANPVLGDGAGTYGRYWVLSGREATRGGALDAHSLYLETLSELGPIGLVLLAAMLLAPLRRPVGFYAAAALGAYTAFLAHAGLDWDWELPVVVVAALCCAAAVSAPDRPVARPARGALRAAVVAAALAAAACAIAGASSSTEPGATKAPRSGAFVQTRFVSVRYLL